MNEQILVRLIAELPITILFLLVGKYLVDNLVAGWKYYVDSVVEKEEKRELEEDKIRERLAIVEHDSVTFKRYIKQIQWNKDRLDEVILKLNLTPRKDDPK